MLGAGGPLRDVVRSVGSQVALARREPPSLGDRFVGLSRALVHEMPCTMAALVAGVVGERHAVAVVAATACLSRGDRAEVDRRLGAVLGRLTAAGAGRAAARVAAELDAASVVARMEAAVRSRRVTVRPAPDGMAYLSVLGPVPDVVGAHAALLARARAVVGGQCQEEGPQGRGVGAVAADTALRLLSGRAVGEVTPVEVHLVMTDRSLLGTGDATRSVFEPARVPGHGSVPAPVARAWLREDPQVAALTRGGAAPPRGGATAQGRPACGCGGCTPARAGGTWLRWTRGGGCSPGCCAGCSCCATTCAPRRGARRRSCTPTTPAPPAQGDPPSGQRHRSVRPVQPGQGGPRLVRAGHPPRPLAHAPGATQAAPGRPAPPPPERTAGATVTGALSVVGSSPRDRGAHPDGAHLPQPGTAPDRVGLAPYPPPETTPHAIAPGTPPARPAGRRVTGARGPA